MSDTPTRKNLLILSTTATGGKTTVALGLIDLLTNAGRKVAFFKPVAQRTTFPSDTPRDRDRTISTTVLSELEATGQPPSLTIQETRDYFAAGRADYFAERVVELYQQIDRTTEIVVVEGMQYDDADSTLAFEVNVKLAQALTAALVLVVDAHDRTPQSLEAELENFLGAYRDSGLPVEGVILNKVTVADGQPLVPENVQIALDQQKVRLFGVVPFVRKISAPRIRDLVEPLNARVLRGEELMMRRALRPMVLAMTAINAMRHLQGGDLVIVPGDRDDVLMMTHLYQRSHRHPELAGLVLTVGVEPSEEVMSLLDDQGEALLPILLVNTDTFTTSAMIQRKRVYIEDDDWEKIRWTVQLINENLNRDALLEFLNIPTRDVVSPAAFRFNLMQRAKALHKRIVLPEGDEPRTLQAASIIMERDIADVILLGDPDAIKREARTVNANIEKAEIIDPAKSPLFPEFVAEYTQLRKHKGMTEEKAADLLQDTVFFGTMMLHRGMVDGLVSGAVHTTAHTILPSFQIIKTKPGVELVSSIFFMLMSDRVWVFGDCAVVPNPTDAQLAQIAIEAYQSAFAFGLNPKVAMISYSTGTSGEGEDVDKVRRATEIVKQQRPDIPVDGPLQFDAAVMPDVAAKKAPNSPVAGQANVFIFPDLNTGNTTYKAVQRSGNYLSVGPMLQGLKRPVNDLSRGALVDDIVYTIALTAIQAGQIEAEKAAEAAAQPA